MDGWSSHPQTGGSSVLGLLGLGRCSTSSCRLTGMAITRHTGNGTHIVSGHSYRLSCSLFWHQYSWLLSSGFVSPGFFDNNYKEDNAGLLSMSNSYELLMFLLCSSCTLL